jgi:transposase, IS30 family
VSSRNGWSVSCCAQQRTDRRRPGSSNRCARSTSDHSHPEGRSQAGHWEGDLIVGTDQQSAIGTLVRSATATPSTTRSDSGSLTFPPAPRQSITWDRGTEMARHLTITATLGAPVYFCDSRSQWQRGSNENTNVLLRDHFPNGTDLRLHPLEHLLAVERELNNCPRRVLGDRSPASLFDALSTSPDQSVLRR